MTDLEMTKLCAEAMFGKIDYDHGPLFSRVKNIIYVEPKDSPDVIKYDPLHDDAQAMALVKKMRLELRPQHPKSAGWWILGNSPCKDLNRAIVECVARMQSEAGNK